MKLRLTLFTLLIGCLPAVYAHSDASFEGEQNGLTRNAFDLFGGAPSDIAVDSSGRVYATMNVPNGVFCLASGATEWSDPPAGADMGSVNFLALGATAGTAFVLNGSSMFRTTDGCATWTELTGSSGDAQNNNYGFRIVFAHNTLLVDTRNGAVDRSTDNGASFTNVTIAAGAQSISALAASPTSGEFYALANMGNGNASLYRSTDSGQSWSDTGQSGSYTDVAVDPMDANRIALSTSQGGVELSTNGGSSWNPLSPPSTAKTTLLFVGARLYKGDAYTDNSTDWSLLGESATGADIVAPVAVHPSDPNILYVGTELGVAVSTNGGTSFTDSVNGIYAVSVQDIAQETDKNIVYLATEQGMAKTTNFLVEGGPTWTFPVPISPSRAYQGVHSVHIDRSNSSRLYAGLLGGEIYYSTDAGANWTQATVGSIGGADIPDILQTDDGTLYATYRSRENNSGGVLRSTDSGATWSVISTGSVAVDCNEMAAIGNTIFVGAGDDSDQSNTNGGVYRYDGTTWTKLGGAVDGQIVLGIVQIGTTLIASSAADSDQNGGVFRSLDSGATWTEVTSKGLRTSGGWYRTLAVDPANTDIVYVAHGRPGGTAEIYYSQDKGATWALLYEGLSDEFPAVMLVDDLTVGSGVGFTGVSVTGSVKLGAKISGKSLTCTLKSGSSKLQDQKVSFEVKKGNSFTRKKTSTTSAKGTATFALGKLKKKTQVRCRFLTKTSGAKRVP